MTTNRRLCDALQQNSPQRDTWNSQRLEFWSGPTNQINARRYRLFWLCHRKIYGRKGGACDAVKQTINCLLGTSASRQLVRYSSSPNRLIARTAQDVGRSFSSFKRNCASRSWFENPSGWWVRRDSRAGMSEAVRKGAMFSELRLIPKCITLRYHL